MVRNFFSLMMALFLLASVVVLSEGFASSLSPFGASIDAGIAYADDDDDDDRRRGRRRY